MVVVIGILDLGFLFAISLLVMVKFHERGNAMGLYILSKIL